MEKAKQIFAAVDIGTQKIVFVIASFDPESGLRIIGTGQSPNSGLKRGAIFNFESTLRAITRAKEKAEFTAETTVKNIFISVNGSHVEAASSLGVTPIRNQSITEEDVQEAIEVSKAIPTPSSRKVLHVLPQSFKVDDQENISDPVGMSGVRLEVNAHVITISKPVIDNLISCCEKADLSVQGVVYQPLAFAEALLNEEERVTGVSLIHMGCESSDIITFSRGLPVSVDSIPVGGQHFTQDLGTGLKVPNDVAELLKIDFGCVFPEQVQIEESVETETRLGLVRANMKTLASILEARAEETLQIFSKTVADAPLSTTLGGGFVYCGGGSELGGLLEMAQFDFDRPVRSGMHQNFKGVDCHHPHYSCAMGLLLYVAQNAESLNIGRDMEKPLNKKLIEAREKLKRYFMDLM